MRISGLLKGTSYESHIVGGSASAAGLGHHESEVIRIILACLDSFYKLTYYAQ